jgi:signal transduction histidine kinase
VKFKYRLERLEEEWVPAGTDRTAHYSYVRPGTYLFRVLACNNDGVWNERGASLAVIILPYFWQTWWFRLLTVIAVLLLVFAVFEMRLAWERRMTRLRLRMARDLHDEVGSNLGTIALLSEVLSKDPRPGAEEVSELRRLAVQTIDSLRDIVWFLDPAADNLGELVLRMKDAARTMLRGTPFEFTSTGEETAPKPSLDLRRNLFPMFKEILHNIARHAHATKVKIEIKVTPRQFLLFVEDNGVGFEQQHVRGGNGLKNLRRRAAELRGNVEIQSAPGQGTLVTLTAPIP